MDPTHSPVPPDPEEVLEVEPAEPMPPGDPGGSAPTPSFDPATKGLDPITAQRNTSGESADSPLAEEAEPPVVQPARPGPGIVMAVVWWLLLMAVQIAVGIGVAVILAIIIVVQHGPEYLQSEMNKSGPNVLFEAPGATAILFFAGTGGNLLFAAGLVAILHRTNFRRTMALRGVNVLHFAVILLAVLPAQIVCGQIMNWAGEFLPRLPGNEQLYEKLSQQGWIMILLGGCLFPALGEELFFRGFLSRGLVARHGVLLGGILASFLFGLMHLDPPQVVGTMALAIMLQVVFLSTKSLLGPFLLHFFNNALAFGMLRLLSQPAVRNTLGGDDPRYPLLLFFAALIAIMATGRLLYETRTHWFLPDGRIWSPIYVTAEMPPAHLGAVPRLSRPHLATVLASVLAYGVFAAILIWEISKGY